MYGLVNKAVETMVRAGFGDETWRKVRERADLPDEPFLSMRTYPDTVTWALVSAASDELGMAPDAVLEAFGRYWVRYSAAEGYGQMLALFGGSLREFLLNLDEMHARLGLSFPDLAPPSFAVTHVTDDALVLHYRSHRDGLAWFVVGLIHGLAERFDEAVVVTHTERKSDGAEHDRFRIVWSDR